jgi:hypothetical protein
MTDSDNSIGTVYNPPPDKKFRIQNQRLLLTYPSHVPKEAFRTWFAETTGGFKQLEIAHETGQSTGIDYQHSHVLIDFGRLWQTTNVRKLDYHGFHPNIRKITSKLHWENSLRYLAKEDPENAHLKVKEPSVAEAIWSNETITDALRSVKKPSDALGVITIFNHKPKETYTVDEPPMPWALEIKEILESEDHDRRTIFWYFDPRGNSGKTWLIKHLYTLDPTRYWFCNNATNLYHFSNLIENAFRTGWTGKAALINLPRGVEQRDIYPGLEALKDGLMTSVKYQGGSRCWENPHVVVMANALPDISRMSLDRWFILEVLPSGETRVVYWLKGGINTLQYVSPSLPSDTLLTVHVVS